MNPNYIKAKEQESEYDEDNNEEFVKETEQYFDRVVWKELKNDIKELSKRELARQMFVSGALMYKMSVDQEMQKSMEFMKEHPEKIKEMMKMSETEMEEDDERSLWDKGSFAETMSSEDMKGKMRTFHMKHDEEMNYNCKNCNAKMSAHNKDWHSDMCDSCFNKESFSGRVDKEH